MKILQEPWAQIITLAVPIICVIATIVNSWVLELFKIAKAKAKPNEQATTPNAARAITSRRWVIFLIFCVGMSFAAYNAIDWTLSEGGFPKIEMFVASINVGLFFFQFSALMVQDLMGGIVPILKDFHRLSTYTEEILSALSKDVQNLDKTKANKRRSSQ